MVSTVHLLPKPQRLEQYDGSLRLQQQDLIALNVPYPATLFFTAKRVQQALQDYADVKWEIVGGDLPAELRILIDDSMAKAEGYRLRIRDSGIEIIGNDTAGVFYGVGTLIQLIQTHGATLPLVEIEDYPDFPARGVMLDISRDKVPTMETLYELIDMLASWKINQFQLYTEHTFAYRNHKKVWEKASAISAEEIMALDAYCRERFVELVPNQNSFGHMHRWFEHEPYLSLAESETELPTPWGTILPPFSLSPTEPGSLELIKELFIELLPNFTSQQFNVGCDETFDLGMGKTKGWVEERGKGRVYLDFLLEIYQLVKLHGKTMQFWGDIINQYPELVPEIPKDTIALEWGYENDHDFPGKSKLFSESGVPFYVCPGTSTWNTIAGRTDNCIGNLQNAAENGLKYGAIGFLNTDWGDRGHWQTLPISYLGYAYGAAVSWAYEANKDIDLPMVLSLFAFRDETGVMGKLAYDLGNAYLKPGAVPHNASLLNNIYLSALAEMRGVKIGKDIFADQAQLKVNFAETVDYIDGVMMSLEENEMQREDAELVEQEFVSAANMIRHGARRALLELADGSGDKDQLAANFDSIVADFRKVWLARNRPGGLDDSVARLNNARKLYE